MSSPHQLLSRTVAVLTAFIRVHKHKVLLFSDPKLRKVSLGNAWQRHLIKAAKERSTLLEDLRNTDYDRYKFTLEKLRLNHIGDFRYEPKALYILFGENKLNKARSIQRRKFVEYHEELEKQQQPFMERKQVEVSAMDKEEKELRERLAELEAADPTREEVLVDIVEEDNLARNKHRDYFTYDETLPPPFMPELAKKKQR